MAIAASPPSPMHAVQDERAAPLQETLDAMLEFTGATAGWIGLLRPDGRLFFPARTGAFSEAWLTLQQGQTAIWGFEIREGPTLLNDPPRLPILGEPPLRNLLSCLVGRGAKPAGQIVLANKPSGFTSHDATALQTTAHLLSRQLIRQAETSRLSLSASLLRRALDHVQEGILIVDHAGNLVFANATWARWTGYPSEELCDRPPPFPFWVSHAELAALEESKPTLADTLLPGQRMGARGMTASGARSGFLPFRHRNHGLFWCQVETAVEKIGGQAMTIACLRRLPAGSAEGGTPRAERAATSLPDALPSPEAAPATAAATGVPLQNLAETPPFQGMALLLRHGGAIEFWDERWEELTGLTRRDLAGVTGELFLDWLFPQQRDRDFVADLFHQPARRGAQALLQIAGRSGNRSLVCTLVPLKASGLQDGGPLTGQSTTDQLPGPRRTIADPWLILLSDPNTIAAEDSHVQRFLRQFTRGLCHLLNNYLTAPVGLAEMALDRTDLPADVHSWFGQILHSCMRTGRLIAALQDLAAVTPGALQRVSLAALVREFLQEYAAESPQPTYELEVELREPDLLVDANPWMLKAILRQLMTNAAEALLHRARRRITVRVYAWETEVCCEIEDTGPGLPTDDWTAVCAPFYSTKGPFAREAALAALDARGLGLTVSQHQAALHGGRLELRSVADEGTTAALILPRRGVAARGPTPVDSGRR